MTSIAVFRTRWAPARPSYPSPVDQAFHRAVTTPDFFAWLHHVSSAAGCSHPIRLAGDIMTVDTSTGQRLAKVSTESMPDGVIYKNCGNRGASACPSCSTIYRRDAYQVIKSGLAGGKDDMHRLGPAAG